MKSNRFWLIFAASLVILGAALFAIVMNINHWEFNMLNTVKSETNTHQIHQDFSGIFLETDTADVAFHSAEDGLCKVVCFEEEKAQHSVEIQDGILTIREGNQKEWYDYIVLSSIGSKIDIYLPQNTYDSLDIKESTGDIKIPRKFSFGAVNITASTGDVQCSASTAGMLKIITSTGDISMSNLSAGALDLSVSTGKIDLSSIVCDGAMDIEVNTGKATLTDITCQRLISRGDTGDLRMKNVIAKNEFSIERDTGDLDFDGCDAAEIFIQTTTGHVQGTFLSEKVFLAQSDTGRIKIPKTITGGRCEITTDTGDIKIEIQK
jgi:DUF4097 and DUF4098 domain-containing protein YvlB